MWLNEKEGQIIGPFKKIIEEHENEKWIFEFNENLILEVAINGEYESDNGLDIKAEGYEQYFAMLFVVLSVIKDDSNAHFAGELIEVNYHNLPKSFELKK